MITNCPSCHQSFEVAGDAWPGDGVTCPHCQKDVRMPKAGTVKYDTSTPLMELSPGAAGEFRPVAIADDEILPAGALLGQYRIERFIGKGGMGTVYKARHAMLQRDVAVKVLPAKFAKDREFVGRFQREALALANLSHPNIVAIHDMGTQGEIYFFAMEYVDGVNLRDVLISKKLPPEQALKLVPQLCEALEYAHSKDIIHRDIKPENIMLDRSGRVKIADFGLAKIVKGDSAGAKLTQTNVIMGTVEYMAPEQRDSLKSVDHRADIYSMGVVLYEMLTGQLPMGRFEPASRGLSIDVRIDDVVLKALERDPGRRYQRASYMATDVTRVIEAGPAAPAPPTDRPIVNERTKKAVGTATNGKLAIRSEGGRVYVSGWDRPEIGFETDGAFEVEHDSALTLLRVESAARGLALFMPAGVQLELVAKQAETTVSGAVGALVIHGGDADVAVSGFDGKLEITTEDGNIRVDKLKTESADLRSDNGGVAVTAFDFSRGRASFESKHGSVRVDALPACGFRYQIHTPNGSCSAPAGASVTGRSASGTVGAGGGQLSLGSQEGSVALSAGAAPVLDARSIGSFFQNLPPHQKEKVGIWVIATVGLYFILEWHWFGFISIIWGLALALELWKSYVHGTGSAPAIPAAGPQAAAAPTPMAPVSIPPVARVSALSVLSFLLAIPTVLVAVLAGIWHFNVATADWGMESAHYWVVLSALMYATMLFGALTFVFAAASRWHLDEARGGLKGRPFASVAGLIGLCSVVLAFGFARPAIRDVVESGVEIRSLADRFGNALKTRHASEIPFLVNHQEQTPQMLEEKVERFAAKRPITDVQVAEWGVESDHRRRNRAHVLLKLGTGGATEPLTLHLVRVGEAWWIEEKNLVTSLK